MVSENRKPSKTRGLGFFIFLIITISLYGLIHRSVYFSLTRIAPEFAVGSVLAALWLLSIASLFIARVKHNIFTSILYWIGVCWMGAVFIMFFVLFPSDIFILITKISLGDWPLIASAVLILFAAYFARSTIVKTIRISIPGLKKPLRVVQLTDIHMGEIYRPGFLRKIVAKTNALKPDLIVITGDVFDGGGKLYDGMVDALKVLRAKHGSYFVRGNHEVYEGIRETERILREMNIKILDNQAVSVGGVELIGVSYPSNMVDDLKETIQKLTLKPAKEPRILLRHEPRDPAFAARNGFSLMLSGHTHNGQIWPLSYLVSLQYPFRVGLHRIGGMHLYIGPGVGTWGPPFRLGSRSEITMFELRPASNTE